MSFSRSRFCSWAVMLMFFSLFPLTSTTAQVIWQEDWETYTLGTMTDKEPETKGWDARLGFGSGQWSVLSDGNGNQYISRLNKANECCYWKGCRMLRQESKTYDDVYFGFRFKFDGDFDFKSGGKLNGIIGGSDPSPGVPTDGSKGASVSMMWRKHPDGSNAIMHTYTYCENKNDQWGQHDTLKAGGQAIKFVRNRWYSLVVRIQMNTQNVANGRITVYLDGNVAMDRNDYLFRTGTGSWGWHINQLIYFFGGNGPGWAPGRDSYVYEDDWILSESLPTHLMNGNTAPQPPTASVTTSGTSGVAPYAVNFDGSGSVDYDGSVVDHRWDFGDGSPIATGDKVSHTYTTPGIYSATLTVTDNDGLKDTRSVVITVTDGSGGGGNPGGGGGGTPGCDPPAGGWLFSDVGAVGLPGEACFDANTNQYQISASGADIWTDTDQFGFVYRPVNGDAEVVVQLLDLHNTHTYAKGGLMMREDLSTNSRHAMIVMNQTQRAFQYRRLKGGTTEPTSGSWIGPSYSHPTWLKMTRQGNVFASFLSEDGSTWSLVDTVHISMKADIFMGIALTSHNNLVMNTSDFGGLAFSGSGSSTFPVELIDFRAESMLNGVKLDWSTATELNNNYFSIERSEDGVLFEHVDHVNGSGTTETTHSYNTVDEDPWDGIIYYRLSQTDFNGVKTVLSTIEYLNGEDIDDRIAVYPNPTSTGRFRLTTIGIPEETTKRVRVLDAGGREILRSKMEGTEAEFLLPPNLPIGIYHVMIDYSSGMLGQTLIVK